MSSNNLIKLNLFFQAVELEEFIKKTHFNEEHPEQNNIFITNISYEINNCYRSLLS